MVVRKRVKNGRIARGRRPTTKYFSLPVKIAIVICLLLVFYLTVATFEDEKNGREPSETLEEKITRAKELENRGKLDDAISLYKVVLREQVKTLGPSDPATVGTKVDLGKLFNRHKKYKESFLIYSDVLQQHEKTNHPDALLTRKILAINCMQLENYPEAIKRLEQILKDEENVEEPNLPAILSTKKNLALAYAQVNDHGRATRIYQDFLKQSANLEGHPETLKMRIDLAGVLKRQGKFDEAFKLYQEAVKEQEELLGSTHLDTLRSKRLLAGVLGLQRKYEDAVQLYTTILPHFEQLLSVNHREVLDLKKDLAVIFFIIGRYSEGLKLYEGIQPGTFLNDPNVLSTITSQAVVFFEKEDYERAAALFHYVSTQEEQLFGPNHRRTVKTKNNLAGALFNQGKAKEALQIYEEILEKQEKLLGSDHQEILTARNNLAVILTRLGKYDKAAELYEELLSRRERLLGPEYVDTISTRNNLALAFLGLGKYGKAAELFRIVYQQEEKSLGRDHPTTLRSKKNYGLALFQLGKHNNAGELFQEVLPLQEKVLGANHVETLDTVELLQKVKRLSKNEFSQQGI